MNKPLLCKLGFHSADKNEHLVRRNYRNHITSRSAFCKRCTKKLYLVNRYGRRK